MPFSYAILNETLVKLRHKISRTLHFCTIKQQVCVICDSLQCKSLQFYRVKNKAVHTGTTYSVAMTAVTCLEQIPDLIRCFSGHLSDLLAVSG